MPLPTWDLKTDKLLASVSTLSPATYFDQPQCTSLVDSRNPILIMSSASISKNPHDAVNGMPIVDLAAGAQPRVPKSMQSPILEGSVNVDESDESFASISPADLFSLKGQGVIVTGGARGLGLCVATSLIQAGAAQVFCLDVLPEPVAGEWSAALEVCSSFGGKMLYKQLDITNSEAVQSTMSVVFDEATQPITGLFAAAGIQQMIPALDYPVDQFRRLMEVNVTGSLNQSPGGKSLMEQVLSLPSRAPRDSSNSVVSPVAS